MIQRIIYFAIGVFFFSLFWGVTAFAGSSDIQYVTDSIRNLDHTAAGGTGSTVVGNDAGGNVMNDVQSINLCGISISRNAAGIKNLQTNQNGFAVVRVNTLEDFIQLVGPEYRELVTQRFSTAEGYSTNGAVYALHKTIDLGCGQNFELTVYDVKSTNYLKTKVSLELIGIKNTTDSDDGDDASNARFWESDSVCKKSSSFENASPFSNDQEFRILDTERLDDLSHVFTMTQQTLSLPYDFGCAGRYRVTYTDYYNDGTTKTTSNNITIPKGSIIPFPQVTPPGTISNRRSTLRISK